MNIDERINKLKAELVTLTKAHDDAITANQRMNKEFQEQAIRNQNRFQQLNGAIEELEALVKDNNG